MSQSVSRRLNVLAAEFEKIHRDLASLLTKSFLFSLVQCCWLLLFVGSFRCDCFIFFFFYMILQLLFSQLFRSEWWCCCCCRLVCQRFGCSCFSWLLCSALQHAAHSTHSLITPGWWSAIRLLTSWLILLVGSFGWSVWVLFGFCFANGFFRNSEWFITSTYTDTSYGKINRKPRLALAHFVSSRPCQPTNQYLWCYFPLHFVYIVVITICYCRCCNCCNNNNSNKRRKEVKTYYHQVKTNTKSS